MSLLVVIYFIACVLFPTRQRISQSLKSLMAFKSALKTSNKLMRCFPLPPFSCSNRDVFSSSSMFVSCCSTEMRGWEAIDVDSAVPLPTTPCVLWKLCLFFRGNENLFLLGSGIDHSITQKPLTASQTPLKFNQSPYKCYGWRVVFLASLAPYTCKRTL